MVHPAKPMYVVDATGKRVAVILSLEEHEALLKAQGSGEQVDGERKPRPLYGALRHLGTLDVSSEEIDETRRELWGAWDKKEFE